MSNDNLNFKVNTSNFLGFEYNRYINDLQALAMSKPSEYYELRSAVLEALKEKVVKEVYDSYYDLLTEGKIKDSKAIMGNRNPAYPCQKASEFALGAASTVNKILDDCLEIILPESHMDVAKLRLTKKGDASQIDATTAVNV